MDERWEQPCTLGWHQFYSTPLFRVCVLISLFVLTNCEPGSKTWAVHQDVCKLLYFSMACSYLCFAWIANPFTIPSSNPFSHWLKSHRRQGLAYISVFSSSSLSVCLSTFNSFVFCFFTSTLSPLCRFLSLSLFPPFIFSFLLLSVFSLSPLPGGWMIVSDV